MDNKHDEIDDFLQNLPDKFHILEDKIDFQTQKEYIDYSHSFDRGELTDRETSKLGKMLFDSKMPVEAKKKVLAILAHLGTITAFRQIEKYYFSSDNDLKQWTAIALQECKMFLESSLTDHMTGFISSGLGGIKDRFRYYFLILPLAGRLFTETQKRIIEEEFIIVIKDLNSFIESFNISDTYIGITALVPMDIAVGKLIETGIKKCNELGDFVLEHYYATNQDIPNESEIIEIIKIVRG